MSRTSSPKSSPKNPRPATRGRRAAAIGAVAALVVALVATGAAIGSSTGGSGKHESSGPAAGAAFDPRQQTYDQLEQTTSRRKDGDPLALGRPDAPVVLVEYADYQCSFCGRFTRETQPELVKKYIDEGVLRIEFRNFPIFGKDSERAARASWAAGRQGKFWQFHDEAFAKLRKGDALAEDKLVDMARTSGVPDLEKFRADMNGSEAEAAVKKDQDEGYRLGVQSTPSFLVGGRPLAGAQPLAEFEDAIAKAKAAKAAGAAGSGKSGK